MYPTPYEAVLPLLPWVGENVTFCEPCAGDGDLVNHLQAHGHQCVAAYDAAPETSYPRMDATLLERTHLKGADYIITNPPWTRELLHSMIVRFSDLAPTWLLFDADWLFTKQASPYLDRCTAIVAVGRVKWIPGSKNTGKDNCAWYRFEKPGVLQNYPIFVGR